MTLNLALVNAAFQLGNDKALVRQACQGADVVAVVEGIRRDGSPVDFPRLVPPGWTVHQNTANAGTAGSVLLTRDAACHAAGVTWHHTSGPGVGLRRRFTLRGTVFDHAEARSGALFVTHVPPKRNVGARRTHMKRLRALTLTPPSLVVGDFNMSPQEAADRLGLDGWGAEDEVMALLHERVTLTDLRVEKVDSRLSDHPILRARVTFPRQKEAPVAYYTPPKFVGRDQWGATPRGATVVTHPIGSTLGVTLHWEGPHMGAFSHDLCAGKVRGIQSFHKNGRGWADIAYNAVVCPHGYIYEGRGVGVKSAANGDTGPNDDWYAVCYLGGEGDGFTAEGKAAMIEAVRWLRSYGAGQRVNGHRDHKATACPGDEVYRWLQTADFDEPLEPPPPTPKPEPPTRGKHADRIEDAMKKARRAANKSDRPGKAAKWRELLAVLREKFPTKEK